MFNLLSRLFDSDGNANQTLPSLPPLIVKAGESSISALVEVMDQPLTSKEWLLFIRKALLFLKETNPLEETRLYLTERAVLPGDFTSKPSNHFCYAFKGQFLPSGNSDGRVWKPSQGAKVAGNGLMKRYFYFKENNDTKIKRQVLWLKEDENWCWLDYRYNFRGKIKMSQAITPHRFDFKQLVWQLEGGANSLPSIVKEDVQTPVWSFHMPLSPISLSLQHPQSPNRPTSPLRSNSPLPSSFGDTLPTSPSNNVFQSAPNSPLNSNFDDKWLGTPPILPEIGSLDSNSNSQHQEQLLLEPFLTPPISPLRHDYHELEPQAKKRKVEDLAFPPLEPPVSSSIIFSGFDYLLTHLLSYDQVVDTVCYSICTQLIFNRRIFHALGVDSFSLLDKVKQNTVTSMDIREFPGKIISHFIHWLRINCARVTSTETPELYCIVCGLPDHVPHDGKVHEKFFASLDPTFVGYMKDRVKNLYELVSAIISYLLKYPASRASFQQVIFYHLHCPFCSGQKGVHDYYKHEKWTRIWQIDVKPGREPEPQEDIQKYTKVAFDYLMDQVPFQIPSFLLNLSNVRSFLECLVTIWKCIRLAQVKPLTASLPVQSTTNEAN